MDLELDDDQQVLRSSARELLDAICPPALVRRVHEDGEQARDEVDRLWTTLCAHDWPAVGVPTSGGGLGLGFVEVGILVEALGRVVAPGPFLATSAQFVPAILTAGSGVCLAGVASGARTGTVAASAGGRWSQEAVGVRAVRGSGGGWSLSGGASHVLDGATADEVVVVARGEGGCGLFLVPGDAVVAEPLATMDPTLPLADLELDAVPVHADRVLVEPGDPRAGGIVQQVLDVATVAMALSTVATCRRILELTIAHALDREQFGRPIGSFQAVQHRLADCHLAVERADALAWFAVATVAEGDDRLPVAASMAKVAAGDCQRLLTRDGLQLHGGIGYTWEHDLHLWLKRAVTGEQLAGTSVAHRARLARLLGLEAPCG